MMMVVMMMLVVVTLVGSVELAVITNIKAIKLLFYVDFFFNYGYLHFRIQE